MSDKNFIKYKDRHGAVTLTKRGSKYDSGHGDDLFDGISGSAMAETIADEKNKDRVDRTAKVMRNVAEKDRAKNAKEKKKASTGRKDFPFFKHSTKGK